MVQIMIDGVAFPPELALIENDGRYHRIEIRGGEVDVMFEHLDRLNRRHQPIVLVAEGSPTATVEAPSGRSAADLQRIAEAEAKRARKAAKIAARGGL